MISRLRAKFEKLLFQEKSPKKVALACGIAVYIAISPFIGLHTIMLIASGWFFSLNIPLLLTVGYVVNNPWSMLPWTLAGYGVGYLLLHTWGGLPLTWGNPWWMATVNEYVYHYTGIQDVSFWALMVGANVLGIALGIVTYFITHALALKVAAQKNKSKE